jgi:hypothetical protein
VGAILPAGLPVYVIAAGQEMTGTEVGEMLIVVAILGIAFAVSFTIATAFAARRWEKLEVRMVEDGVERQWGKAADKIAYESIERVVVGKNRSGQVIYVRLYTPTSAMYLSELGQMDEVVRLLNRRVSETVVRKEKKVWLDWSNPTAALVFFLPAALTAGLVYGLADRVGGNISNIPTGVIVCAEGLWFLVFRPVSRGGTFRYRGYETVWGILMILLSILLVATVWLH